MNEKQIIEKKKTGLPEKLLTIEDAAKILNIKVSRIRTAIFKREIAYIKLGALIRFKCKHLTDWIERQTINGLSPYSSC